MTEYLSQASAICHLVERHMLGSLGHESLNQTQDEGYLENSPTHPIPKPAPEFFSGPQALLNWHGRFLIYSKNSAVINSINAY